MENFDVLIIGAGFAGAVSARKMAEAGKKVLVIEKRGHIGGNAYDCTDSAGILIHKYGPHIFHTNNERVFNFLFEFTEWNGYQHKVAANIPGENGERIEFPVPFNLDSLETAFGADKANELINKLINEYGAERKVSIMELRKNPDKDISSVSDYVYENVFVHYTEKQWGTSPENIDPATMARVPVFLSKDGRYFQDIYQGLPKDGYTAIFEKMLNHPNIEVRTGIDGTALLKLDHDNIIFNNRVFYGDTIYTGALDELFDHKYGKLPYRTLDFKFETLNADKFQSHGTVNYTKDKSYTRITEFKYMTGQDIRDRTTIVKEYPRAYTGANGEIPYYPIISEKNSALYKKYADMAKKHKNFHPLGRLAEYKYYNMDAVIDRALTLTDSLLKR